MTSGWFAKKIDKNTAAKANILTNGERLVVVVVIIVDDDVVAVASLVKDATASKSNTRDLIAEDGGVRCCWLCWLSVPSFAVDFGVSSSSSSNGIHSCLSSSLCRTTAGVSIDELGEVEDEIVEGSVARPPFFLHSEGVCCCRNFIILNDGLSLGVVRLVVGVVDRRS